MNVRKIKIWGSSKPAHDVVRTL